MEQLASVQKFIELYGWLLLTFFICLHNKLSSFNSIIVQMSEKRDSSVDSKNQRDQHVFMWQSVKVSNVFNILTLNKFSGKWKRFSKTGVPLLVETTTIESNSFPSKTAVRNQYYDKLLWQLQNGSIIKSVVLPESTLFILFFFSSFRTSYQ